MEKLLKIRAIVKEIWCCITFWVRRRGEIRMTICQMQIVPSGRRVAFVLLRRNTKWTSLPVDASMDTDVSLVDCSWLSYCQSSSPVSARWQTRSVDQYVQIGLRGDQFIRGLQLSNVWFTLPRSQSAYLHYISCIHSIPLGALPNVRSVILLSFHRT